MLHRNENIQVTIDLPSYYVFSVEYGVRIDHGELYGSSNGDIQS